MAKAPKQHIDIDRLCIAMQRSRLMDRRYRDEFREAVRQHVGHHWSDESTRERVPINCIALYCQIMGRSLLPKDPRVMLSTFDQQNKAAVGAMESWANREIENMRFANTERRVILDALFGMGITKVALATPAEGARVGWNLPAGKPFAMRIDRDDFVCDFHARDFTECGFLGHRYRVPLEVIRDSSLYHKSRKDLTPTEDKVYNLEGDERLNVLGRGVYAGNYEEFEDFIDLWEVYLPRKRLVLTLADDQVTGAAPVGTGGPRSVALREQEWLGPDTGPYHMLAFQLVPGNLMPKGPIQDLIDLHEALNRVVRKLIRQAERQKNIGVIQSGASEDGERHMTANDGDLIRSDNPGATVPFSWPGADPGNTQFGVWLKDMFNLMGGNIFVQGGLAQEGKTLGQEQLLAQNSSAGTQDMQQTATGHVAEVLKALCWYWWHDPRTTMRTVHKIPGIDMHINRRLTPQQRQQARFDDLDIRVDPYSMQAQTPQQRAQALTQLIGQVMPMMQLLQQQGITLDLNAYFSKMAKYMDDPDITEIIQIQEPPQGEGDPRPSDASPGAPPSEPKEYIRRSLGGNTAQNREATMMNGIQQNSAAVAQTNGKAVGTGGIR